MTTLPDWSYDPMYLPSVLDLSELNWRQKDDFMAHNPLGTSFQILNKEYVASLSVKLIDIIDWINQSTIKILEVWAWNGRLTHFLRQKCLKKWFDGDMDFLSTDDYSWFWYWNPEINMHENNCLNVEQINTENSIKKYNPDIIISSWMPNGIDWTTHFRGNENTKWYVLIWYPEQCWTRESWEEIDWFKREIFRADGNFSWRNRFLVRKSEDSIAALFSRET